MSDTVGETNKAETVREAVGVFYDPDKMQAAVDELQSSGFNHADLSMLAGERAIEEKLGHAYTRADELSDSPDAPRTAYRPPENVGNVSGALIGAPLYVAAATTAGLIAATGGAFAAAVAGAALAGGAGGLLGLKFANKFEETQTEKLMELVCDGGLLLWVRTPDKEREDTATRILSKHGASDVHVHTLPLPEENRGPIPDALSSGTERL